MKKNFPVSGVEFNYADNLRIISTTDTKGITTHANQVFIDISGFTSNELLGKSHNVVRHPDMPPAAFEDLWSTLKQHKPWMGIVKNRRKNGDHYWVDAYVTPMIDKGHIVGYQSVRVKPDREHVGRAADLYNAINTGRNSRLQPFVNLLFGSLGKKVFATIIASQTVVLASIAQLQDVTRLNLGIAALAGLTAGGILAGMLARPWRRAAQQSKKIFTNPIAQHVYTGRTDELGQLELVIKQQKSNLDTILTRMQDVAERVHSSSSTASATANSAYQAVKKQQTEVDSVATAMNEMTATVQEVAKNAATTAEAAHVAQTEVHSGQQVLSVTAASITEVSTNMVDVVSAITKVNQSSTDISSILAVITSIAEQTNLLALNAAIEAARAGEQGRGFAVVADEVRSLANRTQQSTSEIHKMIDNLQTATRQANLIAEKNQLSVAKSVDHTQQANQILLTIADKVSDIVNMNMQIATAAEEQASVAEEMNRNIVNIHRLSEQTVEVSLAGKQTNDDMLLVAENMEHVVRQFGRPI